MFEVDFNKVVIWLLTIRRRTAFNIALMKAMIAPVVEVYNEFKSYRETVLYDLAHNGQVCKLRGVLNDAFDIAERRITISDAGGYEVTLLHPNEDLKEVILQPNDQPEAALIVQPNSSYDGGEYDFIVTVPFSISEGQLYKMKALLNKYKLAGKRYDIRIE